ncbi:hypothetical protein [Thauera sinica]|uniref:Secreted protein n=1 Tax=Thauera sinica TaxID=2665146 RepID=A0ABW1APJ4_9RHOO
MHSATTRVVLMLACWRAGVLACWRAGVLACWRAGVLACWRAGVLACWRAGVLACSGRACGTPRARRVRCRSRHVTHHVSNALP